MHAAYCRLHELGYAHSIEAWQDDQLVGGLYGVAMGRAFFGESMFYVQPNASKAAFVTLIRALNSSDYTLLDCQQTTPHMVNFGGFEVSRLEFTARLEAALKTPTQCGRWSLRHGSLECRALAPRPISRNND